MKLEPAPKELTVSIAMRVGKEGVMPPEEVAPLTTVQIVHKYDMG